MQPALTLTLTPQEAIAATLASPARNQGEFTDRGGRRLAWPLCFGSSARWFSSSGSCMAAGTLPGLRRRLQPIDGEPARHLDRRSPRLERTELPPLAMLPRATRVGRPDHHRAVPSAGGRAGGDSGDARSARAARRAGPRVRPRLAARSAGRIRAASGGDRLLALSAGAFSESPARLAREEVCDNYVLRARRRAELCRNAAGDFSNVLFQTHRGRPPWACSIPTDGSNSRVAELLNPRRNVMVRIHRVASALLAVLFITAVVVVAGTRLLQAEPPAAPSAGGRRSEPADDVATRRANDAEDTRTSRRSTT